MATDGPRRVVNKYSILLGMFEFDQNTTDGSRRVVKNTTRQNMADFVFSFWLLKINTSDRISILHVGLSDPFSISHFDHFSHLHTFSLSVKI